MWCLRFLFIVVSVCTGQILTHKKITGIPSQPQDILLLEFKPKIELQKLFLSKEIQNLESLIKLAQNLIQSNIATSKNIATKKINDLKHSISTAKEEAKFASTAIKLCINKQEYEIPKIYSAPPLTCYANYTHMIEIKNKLSKLQLINGQLVANYNHLYMEDSEKDTTLFRKSIVDRLADIYTHIDRIREEFFVAFSNVITDSLECLIEGNFETFKNIGCVMNSLKNCKDVIGAQSFSSLRHILST
ncbi:hypothetical protein WA026_019182 [Henosepilachna vigintioctopunctata]|uniref:Uncharacterized protein n=1 Tax=Henosepilachna vigintioctopunctata TaxID=420089 RepID=A0AAW1V2A6_9CUCU